MGNYVLILTMGILVVAGGFTFSSRESTRAADDLLGETTFKNVAREASVTGLSLTLRNLVSDTTSWATAPTQYGFTAQPYQDARFTTRISAGYGSTVVHGRCVVDTVDAVSTATSNEGTTHEIRGTYVRTCSNPGGIPPWMKYVTISDRDFTLASSPEIRSISRMVNADIHTNQELLTSSAPLVEGFGSYVNGYKCPSTTCDGFIPNVNPAGVGEDNVIQSSYIQLPHIVPANYAHLATYTSPGSVEDLTGVTFDFTNFVPPEGGPAITGFGTEENPFLWYVPGDFDVKKSGVVRTLGHGVIITEGEVHINAGSSLFSSVPDGMFPPSLPTKPKESDYDAIRDWFELHLPEGNTLAFYSEGDIHLNGVNSIAMAQLYTNGPVHVNGGQVLYGSAITRDEMKFNGSGINIWYAGSNSSMVLPNMVVVLPDGIRTIAYSEW